MPITASGSSSDLNLNHYKILNLTDPTVSSDAVNKKYVDRQITLVNSKITNPQTPEFKRYSDYQHIKETFKPTFWISGHYNNGLKIDNDSTRVNDTLIELTGSGYSTENQLFEFWSNQVGSVWLNGNVKLNHKTNDGKRKFMILRNNDNSKDAWLNGEQYVTNS